MIIDVHSHVWEYPRHFRRRLPPPGDPRPRGVEGRFDVRYEDYRGRLPARHQDHRVRRQGPAQRPVGRRGTSRTTFQHADTLIGFLLRRPTQRAGSARCREGHESLGLRGTSSCRCTRGSARRRAARPALALRHAEQTRSCSHGDDLRRAGRPSNAPRATSTPSHPVPRRQDHHGAPRPPVQGECLATFGSIRTSTPRSALYYRPFQFSNRRCSAGHQRVELDGR